MTTHFNWMNYWDGTKPADAERVPFDPLQFPDLASARALWETVKLKSSTFVGQLDDAQTNGVYSLPQQHGGQVSMTLWQMMTQVATHTVQHNSEMAEALTALGFSPGDLDYLYFILGDQH